MQAITFSNYGGPSVLALSEVEKPTPTGNQVLIKIYATSVNSADCRLRRADPWLVRLLLGITKPRVKILGGVFSGVIDAIGKDVTKYKVGDEVFGSTGLSFGAYAEYKCLSQEATMAIKPKNLTHIEASSITFGGLTALYFVQKAEIKKGQKVLVYGASGSVGSAIVQLVKYYGGEVTAVCSGPNFALATSLGADKLIDYTTEDFRHNSVVYDTIFETVNKISFDKSLQSLTKEGTLVLIAAGFGEMLKGVWHDLTSQQKVISGTFPEKTESLKFLSELTQTGNYKAVVDKVYQLKDMPAAHRYVENGHKKGNVVIQVLKD
jgi:NADPH:quinone reductase-like Zn-dependent oxidoreductase